MEHRKILLSVMVMSLTLVACGGDSGNNSAESEGDSSSSMPFSSSSQRLSSSSAVQSSSSFSSSVGASSSSLLVVSSSSVTSQSSSSAPLSSSAIASSSSSTEDGTLTYEGQTYKTVTIGTQTWMAENLNYAVDSSWCYKNSPDSCAKYGRLYQWASAMNIASTYNSTTWGGSDVKHQGICPDGWHIPNKDEQQTLNDYVDANNDNEAIGTSLKSVNGWKPYSGIATGTDRFGFSAFPAGDRSTSGNFYDFGSRAFFWGATEDDSDSDYAVDWNLYSSYEEFNYNGINPKSYGLSVRCLKNAK